MTEPEARPGSDDERPPFGLRWGVLYGVVLLNLAVFVAVCYVFTKTYE